MGLVRMNRRTTHRLGSALRLTENGPIGKQGAGPMAGYTPYPEQERPFELAAELEEGGSANAYLRRPQPDGSYVTDNTDTITVRDTVEVGYNGASGAKGKCKIRYRGDTGARFGEICELECP